MNDGNLWIQGGTVCGFVGGLMAGGKLPVRHLGCMKLFLMDARRLMLRCGCVGRGSFGSPCGSGRCSFGWGVGFGRELGSFLKGKFIFL